MVLSIAGSRVAADPESWIDWLFVVSSAITLFVSDILRDVDDSARRLAASSGSELRRARTDTFEAQVSHLMPMLLLLAGVLALVAIGASLVNAMDTGGQRDGRPSVNTTTSTTRPKR